MAAGVEQAVRRQKVEGEYESTLAILLNCSGRVAAF